MPTECISDLFGFASAERRRVETAFDGRSISSDAGGLLLGATDRAVRLVDRFAACFRGGHRADLVEHEVRTLVGQRVLLRNDTPSRPCMATTFKVPIMTCMLQ